VENKCQFHQLSLSMIEASSYPTIVSNVRDISHITSQILQIYGCAEPDQNPDQTVLVRFGFFTFTGSVRVLHIFLHVSSRSVWFCQNLDSSLVWFPSLLLIDGHAMCTTAINIYNKQNSPCIAINVHHHHHMTAVTAPPIYCGKFRTKSDFHCRQYYIQSLKN